jgi:hypothetical protein
MLPSFKYPLTALAAPQEKVTNTNTTTTANITTVLMHGHQVLRTIGSEVIIYQKSYVVTDISKTCVKG